MSSSSVIYVRQGTPLVRLSPTLPPPPAPPTWSWSFVKDQDEEQPTVIAAGLTRPDLDLLFVQPLVHSGFYTLLNDSDGGSVAVAVIELRVIERWLFRLLDGDGHGSAVSALTFNPNEALSGDPRSGSGDRHRRTVVSALAELTFEECQAALRVINSQLERTRVLFAGHGPRPALALDDSAWLVGGPSVTIALLARGGGELRRDGARIWVSPRNDAREFELTGVGSGFPPDGDAWLAPQDRIRYLSWDELDSTLKDSGIVTVDERRQFRSVYLDHLRTVILAAGDSGEPSRITVHSSGLCALQTSSAAASWITEGVLETHLIDSEIFTLPEWLRRTDAGSWNLDELREHVRVEQPHERAHLVTTRRGSVAATLLELERDGHVALSAQLVAERRFSSVGSSLTHTRSRWYLAPVYSRVQPETGARPVPGSEQWAAVPHRLLVMRSSLDQLLDYAANDVHDYASETRCFDRCFAEGASVMLSAEDIARELNLELKDSISFCLLVFDEQTAESPDTLADLLPGDSYASVPPRVDTAPIAGGFLGALGLLNRAHSEPLPAVLAAEHPNWHDTANRVALAYGSIGVSRGNNDAMGATGDTLLRAATTAPTPTLEPGGRRTVVPALATAQPAVRFDALLAPTTPVRRLAHVFVVHIRPYVPPVPEISSLALSRRAFGLSEHDDALLDGSDGDESLDPVHLLWSDQQSNSDTVIETIRERYPAVSEKARSLDPEAWRWIEPAARNRMRARQMLSDAIAAGRLEENSASWSLEWTDLEARVRLGLRRIVNSTDGYYVLRDDQLQSELESPFVPVLPGEYERRVLFDPRLGRGLRSSWLKRIYRDMANSSFEAAVRSILYEERERRLCVYLWTLYDCIAGSYRDDMLLLKSQDLMAWLASDKELQLDPNYADPLRMPLIAMLELLESTQRRIERLCNEQLCRYVPGAGPACARRCRLRFDYQFRDTILTVFWPRVWRLLERILPDYDLEAVFGIRPSCLDVVQLRESDYWKRQSGANDEDVAFIEHFFEIKPLTPSAAAGLDETLARPSVARRLLALPAVDEITTGAAAAEEELAAAAPAKARQTVAVTMAQAAQYLFEAELRRENRAVLERADANWDPSLASARVQAFAIRQSFGNPLPFPLPPPTVRSLMLNNFDKLARDPVARHLLLLLLLSPTTTDIPPLIVRASRLDAAMYTLFYGIPAAAAAAAAQHGSLLLPLPEERLLVSMRAAAEAHAAGSEAVAVASSAANPLWQSALNDAISTNNKLKAAARQLASEYLSLLHELAAALPLQPDKWKAALDRHDQNVQRVEVPTPAEFKSIQERYERAGEKIRDSLASQQRFRDEIATPFLARLRSELMQQCVDNAARFTANLAARGSDELSLTKLAADANNTLAQFRGSVQLVNIRPLVDDLEQRAVRELNAAKLHRDADLQELQSSLANCNVRVAQQIDAFQQTVDDWFQQQHPTSFQDTNLAPLQQRFQNMLQDRANASDTAIRQYTVTQLKKLRDAVRKDRDTYLRVAEPLIAHILAVIKTERDRLAAQQAQDEATRLANEQRALEEARRRSSQAKAEAQRQQAETNRLASEEDALRKRRESEMASEVKKEADTGMTTESQANYKRQLEAEEEKRRQAFAAEQQRRLAQLQADERRSRALAAEHQRRLEDERRRQAPTNPRRYRIVPSDWKPVGSSWSAPLFRQHLQQVKTQFAGRVRGVAEDEPENYVVMDVGGAGECWFYVASKASDPSATVSLGSSSKLAQQTRLKIVQYLAHYPGFITMRLDTWLNQVLTAAIGASEQQRLPAAQRLLAATRKLAQLGRLEPISHRGSAIPWNDATPAQYINLFALSEIKPPSSQDNLRLQFELYQAAGEWMRLVNELARDDNGFVQRFVPEQDRKEFQDLRDRFVRALLRTFIDSTSQQQSWTAAWNELVQQRAPAMYVEAYKQMDCYALGAEVAATTAVLSVEFLNYRNVGGAGAELGCATEKQFRWPHEITWNQDQSHFMLVVYQYPDGTTMQHVFNGIDELPPLVAIDYLANCVYAGTRDTRTDDALRTEAPTLLVDRKLREEFERILPAAAAAATVVRPSAAEIVRHLEAFRHGSSLLPPKTAAYEDTQHELQRTLDDIDRLRRAEDAAAAADVAEMSKPELVLMEEPAAAAASPPLSPPSSPGPSTRSVSALPNDAELFVAVARELPERATAGMLPGAAQIYDQKIVERRPISAADVATLEGASKALFTPANEKLLQSFARHRLETTHGRDIMAVLMPELDAMTCLAQEIALAFEAFDRMFDNRGWLYHTAYQRYIRRARNGPASTVPLGERWKLLLDVYREAPSDAISQSKDAAGSTAISKLWDALIEIRRRNYNRLQQQQMLPVIQVLLSETASVGALLTSLHTAAAAESWLDSAALVIARQMQTVYAESHSGGATAADLASIWTEAVRRTIDNSGAGAGGGVESELLKSLRRLRHEVVQHFANELAALDDSTLLPSDRTTTNWWSSKATAVGKRLPYQMLASNRIEARDDMRGATRGLAAFLAAAGGGDSDLWAGTPVLRLSDVKRYDPSVPDLPQTPNYNAESITTTDVARVALFARVSAEISHDIAEAFCHAWFGGGDDEQQLSVAREWALARSFTRYALAPVEEVRSIEQGYWIGDVTNIAFVLWTAGDLVGTSFRRFWPFEALASKRTFVPPPRIEGISPEVPSADQLLPLVVSEMIYHLTLMASFDTEKKNNHRQLRAEAQRHPMWRAIREFIVMSRAWDEIYSVYRLNDDQRTLPKPSDLKKSSSRQADAIESEHIWDRVFEKSSFGELSPLARFLSAQHGDISGGNVGTAGTIQQDINNQLLGVATGQWTLLRSGEQTTATVGMFIGEMNALKLKMFRTSNAAAAPFSWNLVRKIWDAVFAAARKLDQGETRRISSWNPAENDLAPRIIWPLLLSYRLLHSLYQQAYENALARLQQEKDRSAVKEVQVKDLDLADQVFRRHSQSLAFLYDYLILPPVTLPMAGGKFFALAQDKEIPAAPMFVPVALPQDSAVRGRPVIAHDFFDARCLADYLVHSRWSIRAESLSIARLARWHQWLGAGGVGICNQNSVVAGLEFERTLGRPWSYLLNSEQAKDALAELRDRVLLQRGRVLVHYDATRRLVVGEPTDGYNTVERISKRATLDSKVVGFNAYFTNTLPEPFDVDVPHLESRGVHVLVRAHHVWLNVSAWSTQPIQIYATMRAPATTLQPTTALVVYDGLFPAAARHRQYTHKAHDTSSSTSLPVGYHVTDPLPPTLTNNREDTIMFSDTGSPLLDRVANASVIVEESAYIDWMRRLEQLLLPLNKHYPTAIPDKLNIQEQAEAARAEAHERHKDLVAVFAQFNARLDELWQTNCVAPLQEAYGELSLPADRADAQQKASKLLDDTLKPFLELKRKEGQTLYDQINRDTAAAADPEEIKRAVETLSGKLLKTVEESFQKLTLNVATLIAAVTEANQQSWTARSLALSSLANSLTTSFVSSENAAVGLDFCQAVVVV